MSQESKLTLLEETKVLQGMLMQHHILLRWIRENLAKMGEDERGRVAQLLDTMTTSMRGQAEDVKVKAGENGQ